MTNVIMHGCNGKMGKNIANLIKEDEDVTLVAGIDAFDEGKNPFPVFTDINECDVAADVIIDFSAAPAIDGLLDYCVAKQIPCVLCTTGLSKEQLDKVEEASKKVAILRSANMSLGINMLLKILKEATEILAPAGFDIEIVEKHHNQKVQRLRWGMPSTKCLIMSMNMCMIEVTEGRRDPRKKSDFRQSEAVPLWVTMT